MAPRLSLSMIVRDEAGHLPRALETARLYADEIVVVDTGSKDDTRAVAARLADRVGDFVWCDDFAKARNHALSLCTGDFVATLDADDVVEPDDARRLRALVAGEPDWDVCRIPYALTADGRGKVNMYQRLWRNRVGIRWVSPIHEYLDRPGGPPLREHWCREGVRVTHRPIAQVVRTKDRRARNLRILERALATEEYRASWHLWWHLGKECLDADHERGIEAVRKALELNPARGTRVRSRQCLLLAKLQKAAGRPKDALESLGRAIAEWPAWREPYWMMATIHLAEGRPAYARALLEAAGRIARPGPAVDKSFLYGPEWAAEVSRALEATGEPEEALREVRAALREAPDNPRLREREGELLLALGQAGPPCLREVGVEPGSVAPGGTLRARFEIESAATLRVVLGMSLQAVTGGRLFSDPAHDVQVVVGGGLSHPERLFKVPKKAPPGAYDLLCSLTLPEQVKARRRLARWSKAGAVTLG